MSENLDDILGSEEINTLSVEATDTEMRRIADLANKQLELERGVTTLEDQLKAKKKNCVT